MTTGTTFINHGVRVRLGLSLQEYTVMQFLADCKEKKITINEESFISLIGVHYIHVVPIMDELQKKGLIIGTLPNHKWSNEFIEDIDRLWSVHKKGSRAKAKERLSKVLKKITIEELIVKLTEYVKSKPPEEFEYLKGLDVWLNPKTEHWNDPIIKSKNLIEEKASTITFETKVYNR